MNADQLLELYDRVADAPDAITRLRPFVLDLALRGKLVEQDLADEPALELLKRIKKEKAKAGQKPSAENPDREKIAFRLPKGWAWTTLGTVSSVTMGQSPPGETYNTSGDGVPLINGPVEFTAGPFGKTVVNQYTTAPTNFCEEGDLLICVRGSTTGRTNVAAFRACIGRGVAAIHSSFDDGFVRLFIWRARYDIIEMGRGIAFPSVSKKQIEDLVFPLPPLAEQQRIVAKVDELMALLDGLEQARAGREVLRDQLTAAALNRLTESNPNDFHPAAQFALQTLSQLTTRPDQIKTLRQTTLNLAVRGKLVEQDPADEPASELLKRIGKQRLALIAAGIAKKEKLAEAVAAPFTLPESWTWCGLGQLCQLITKGSSPKWQGVSYVTGESGLMFITSENVGNFILRKLDDLKYVESRFRDIEPRSMLKKGDILINLVGASIGRTAIFNLDAEANINQAVALVRLVDPTLGPSIDYLLMYLNSDTAVDQMLGSRVITAQPNISLADVNGFPIPLPPLAEQHRIVARVDALMALCDQLEAGLKSTDTTRSRLLDAILHSALSQDALA